MDETRIDNKAGTGDYTLNLARYKDGEETRYKFQVSINLPSYVISLPDGELKTLAKRGASDLVSNRAAAIFRKENDYGSLADAAEFAARFTSDETWAVELAKKERAERQAVDTSTSATISQLVLALKQKVEKGYDFTLAKVAVPGADAPPVDKNGKTNYRAWAKMLAEAEHPWFTKTKAEVEKKADKLD